MRGLKSAIVVLLVGACATTITSQVTVAPRVSDIDLRTLPRSSVWRPGDPVREVPDLTRTDAPVSTLTLDAQTLRVVAGALVVQAADGTVIAGPFTFRSLWPSGADPCGVEVEWPPALQVDRAARRWIVSQRIQPFGAGADVRTPLCVAVSQSADAVAGGWWLYEFPLPVSLSEAAILVMNDSYRVPGQTKSNAVWVTLDRAAMLEGRRSGVTVSPR